MESFGGYNIIGGTEAQREKYAQELAEKRSKTGTELWGDELLAPTHLEELIIEDCLDHANKVAASFGADSIVDPKQIFIIKDGAIGRKKNKNKDDNDAVADSKTRTAAIEKKDLHPAVFARAVIHEAFHLLGVNVDKIDKGGYGVAYRGGLSLVRFNLDEGNDSMQIFFIHMEEAIIAELTTRALKEIIYTNPAYADDVKATEEVKRWLMDYAERAEAGVEKNEKTELINDLFIIPYNEKALQTLSDPDLSDAQKIGRIEAYYEKYLRGQQHGFVERHLERKELNLLAEELVNKSHGLYPDRDSVINEFAKAHFSGKYLPLARKIEKVLGKGSFRNIAERFGSFHYHGEVD